MFVHPKQRRCRVRPEGDTGGVCTHLARAARSVDIRPIGVVRCRDRGTRARVGRYKCGSGRPDITSGEDVGCRAVWKLDSEGNRVRAERRSNGRGQLELVLGAPMRVDIQASHQTPRRPPAAARMRPGSRRSLRASGRRGGNGVGTTSTARRMSTAHHRQPGQDKRRCVRSRRLRRHADGTAGDGDSCQRRERVADPLPTCPRIVIRATPSSPAEELTGSGNLVVRATHPQPAVRPWTAA